MYVLKNMVFKYCVVVSKNGFCWIDFFLIRFFFHILESCMSIFCWFYFFSSKAKRFQWWFVLLQVSECSIRHWRKKKISFSYWKVIAPSAIFMSCPAPRRVKSGSGSLKQPHFRWFLSSHASNRKGSAKARGKFKFEWIFLKKWKLRNLLWLSLSWTRTKAVFSNWHLWSCTQFGFR